MLDSKDQGVIISAMAWEGFVSIVKQVWHKIEWCDGQPDFFGFRDPDMKCPYCLAELVEKRRIAHYNAWDRLGLGYIGPKAGS